MQFLVFTLYAPIGSFGETAVGERRMSWTRPGRSAVMGLVAAAQGIDRDDEAAHLNLEASLHFAVRTDAPGRPFLDYHTAQTPKSRRGRVPATRQEELATDDLNTVLSSREWRTDAFFTVALWLRSGGTVNISEIADAMCRPRFVLYAGRKSAPLGLPLNPRILEAGTFMEAFAARTPNGTEQAVLRSIGAETSAVRTVAFDHDVPDAPSNSFVERRRDAVVSRVRWQFSDRLEGVVQEKAGS